MAKRKIRRFRAFCDSLEALVQKRGKPQQNGYTESLNDKIRDECLSDHWFKNLAEARAHRRMAARL
ncbi:MAG: transposase [Alphaproteobacteria bacterium]|nr:transposase [Alphaproteobacteria bacterium]